MAQALKKGYEEIYIRNEYAHDMSRPEVVKVVSDITGQAHDNGTVKAIVGTFFAAKELADFEANLTEQKQKQEDALKDRKDDSAPLHKEEVRNNGTKLNLGLSYTINLVLPKTDDPAVYDAIFRSLKDNLLHE